MIANNTPWPVVAFKQWTDQGTIPGINGKVDLDVFFGSPEELNAYSYTQAVVNSNPITPNEPSNTSNLTQSTTEGGDAPISGLQPTTNDATKNNTESVITEGISNPTTSSKTSQEGSTSEIQALKEILTRIETKIDSIVGRSLLERIKNLWSKIW